MRFTIAHVSVAALVASGCTPAAQTASFRSLESSGTAAFVCLAVDLTASNEIVYAGNRSMRDCPDSDPVDGQNLQTYGLVTQTTRGEVAVVGLNASDTTTGKALGGFVVDEEPTVPGNNFLPVGAAPTDIVATPGSAAVFVASGEVGKEGIYAIPTTCALGRLKHPNDKTPQHDTVVRDITLWPACHLDSAPGKMAILIDPPGPDGTIRTSCSESKAGPADGGTNDGGTTTDAAPILESDAAAASARLQQASSCPARVDEEPGPPGRRKLVVSLPDEGKIVVIDAQKLLDQPPGRFDRCPIDRDYPPLNDVITPIEPIVQKLPPDLKNIFPAGLPHPPPPKSGYTPRPAGFAQLDDSSEQKLFIADVNAPIIHRLDTRDPCDIVELPPLLPVAYDDPNRVVTTTKVAVMDRVTKSGQRFLYAIDQLGFGQVMIFDVSPGSTERTPIVRARSPFMPFEQPDRLGLSAPAVDLTFVTENNTRAPDPVTGTESLVACDPTPGSSSPGTAYQPTIPDYLSGARPAELRGTFGLLALSNGQIAVVDEEDLDAPCRRPVTPNPGKNVDFHGCANDKLPSGAQFFTKDGKDPNTSIPTVTQEATCHVVEQHRSRSANLVLNNANQGGHAPFVRSFPKLVDKNGRGLSTDPAADGRTHPRMLGVNFKNFPANPQDHAQVYVGTDLFQVATSPDPKDTPTHQLFIDPKLDKTKTNSVVLSVDEPRAYLSDAGYTATFEGRLFDERVSAGVLGKDAKSNNVWLLRDTGIQGGFCAAGVQAEDIAANRARSDDKDATKALGVTDEDRFRVEYADYVVITSDLLPPDDPYWGSGQSKDGGPPAGATCINAHAENSGEGYRQCRVAMGSPDIQAPADIRQLRITHATRDTLTVTQRKDADASIQEANMEALKCCFPEPVSYTVRASHEWLVQIQGQPQEEIVTAGGPEFACIRNPDPRFSLLPSRAFEVSCKFDSPDCLAEKGDKVLAIGPDLALPPPPSMDQTLSPRTRACVVTDPAEVSTIGAGTHPGCIFTSLTASFVIYAGANASETDMQFQWEVGGGFSPLLVNLSAPNDPITVPQALLPSPFPGTVIVADGGDKGLVIVDLTTFSPFSIF